MIDRQVYNHPCTKIIYNSVYFVLFNLSCIVVQHETDLQNILRNPRIIIFPTRIFLTFIKLSYNKLISTRYLSDIGYLTFRSFDEEEKKKTQDNLQGSSLFHHHHHLLRISSSIFETARPSIENKRQTTAHETHFNSLEAIRAIHTRASVYDSERPLSSNPIYRTQLADYIEGREHLSNPLIRVSGHGSVVRHVVVLWLCRYEGLFGLCKVITGVG